MNLQHKSERELTLKEETVVAVAVANKSSKVAAEVAANNSKPVMEVMMMLSSSAKTISKDSLCNQRTSGSLNSTPLGVVTANHSSQSTSLLPKD